MVGYLSMLSQNNLDTYRLRVSLLRTQCPRAIAAIILEKMLTRRKNLSVLLTSYLPTIPKQLDQRLLQTLCYGVARWFYQLSSKLDLLLHKQIPKKHTDLKVLALIGLYQIDHLNIPPYAIINTTVQAANDLKKPWAKGLINALLQKYLKEQSSITSSALEKLVAYHAHSEFLLTKLAKDWPHYFKQMMDANNLHPPMFLRVNKIKMSRENYLAILKTNGYLAKKTVYSNTGIKLQEPVDISKLPGFYDGMVSVQDEAAQLAADLLEVQPQQHVLDACAAPGGKTTHLLENHPNLNTLVAIEKKATRVEKLHSNLTRLGLSAKVIKNDAKKIATFWDGRTFDRILLDAPCSGTGTIRRHPDLKIILDQKRIDTHCKEQADLLNALWPTLSVGGQLLYITCSVLKIENELQIKKFLSHHQDAKVSIIDADWGIDRSVGRQILPGQTEMDGFFYAKIKKTPEFIK